MTVSLYSSSCAADGVAIILSKKTVPTIADTTTFLCDLIIVPPFVCFICPVGPSLEPVLERFDALPFPGLVDEFIAGMDRDRGDPRRELGASLEPGQTFENVQKDLLKNLLVRRPVPDVPVDQVIDEVLVVLDQPVRIHRHCVRHDGARRDLRRNFFFIYQICLISERNVARFL
jgi:hypothetical protein